MLYSVITGVFTIVRTLKPKCPLTKDWTEKISYIPTTEYCRGIRKRESYHIKQHEGRSLRDLRMIKKVIMTKTNIGHLHRR